MLKFFKKTLLTLLAFVLCIPLCKAQFEVGAIGGVCHYQGDLTDPTVVSLKVQPAFGVFLRYTPDRFITLRGNFIQGKLKASDLKSPDPSTRYRGITLESTIREFAVIGEFNFLGNSNEGNFDVGGVLFNPYVYLGLGVVSTDGTPVAPKGTRPYPFPEDGSKSVLATFPLGLGAKVQFGDYISVGLDFGIRTTFSDYLDGVSKVANPKSNDYYAIGNLTFSYCFGNY